VELNDTYREDGDGRAVGEPEAAAPPLSNVVQHFPRPVEPATPAESAAEGVKRAGRILASATNARWPMYLRNVKHVLRQADGGFDERRYGFAGLMDLLRACQKENLVRLERDRRGGLRVFQGSALQSYAATPQPVPAEEHVEVVDAAPVEAQPGEVVEARVEQEIDQPEVEPIPIDATAELLGRARPKRTTGARSRARVPRAEAAATPRKSAAKKPAARRSTRAKKTTNTEHTDH
jgi:hypothetical protein